MKAIKLIESFYDRFGNPIRISFSDGSYTENVYPASGENLKSTHATSFNGTVTGKTTTEYQRST